MTSFIRLQKQVFPKGCHCTEWDIKRVRRSHGALTVLVGAAGQA